MAYAAIAKIQATPGPTRSRCSHILQRARMQLRARMNRTYEHGGWIKDADFIIMWPEKYKPRPHLVPMDRRDNPQLRLKRPRYAVWKPELRRTGKGQQRIVELHFDDDDDDDALERNEGEPSSRSRTPALVWDEEDADNEFEDDFFDFDDDSDPERDMGAARKEPTQCLGGYYRALDAGCPKDELEWRRLL